MTGEKRIRPAQDPSTSIMRLIVRATFEWHTGGRPRRVTPSTAAALAKAAEAIRFAIEELSPTHLLGAHLEVEEQRFDRDGIRRLYDSEDYPLARRDPPADECFPSKSAEETDRSGAR